MNVLLVHGLGRTPVSLFPLASALRKAGHRTHFFGYSSTLETWDRIVRRLTDKLQAFNSPVGLVAHSLGGLLLRAAMPLVPGLRVHQLLMLGTPNRPPRLAPIAWRFWPFRVLAGTSGDLLAHPMRYDAVPIPCCPTTTFAGTAGPRGRFSPFGNDANDGVVAVSETILEGHPPPIQYPVIHTWIMNDWRIQHVVVDKMNANHQPVV